jgi:hypothetical protein
LLYTLFATRDYLRGATICGALPRYAVIFSKKEGSKLQISPKQWKALAKRGADFMEKLSIVGFGYAFFQANTAGAIVGTVCLVVSGAVTFIEAKE